MTDFEKLIKFFETEYYGDFIMQFFELIAIITGLILARKDKIGVFFLVYLIFDFSILIIDIYIQVFSPLTSKDISLFIYFTNNVICLVELVVYFYFFSRILQNKRVIRLLKVSEFFFAAIILVLPTMRYSFSTIRYAYISDIIGTIEFILLIPPCFAYYYELFKNDSVIKLHSRPSFWIVTGIFFYSVISIPYYMITSFILTNQLDRWTELYLLFFCIPFSINFIFLTKAFLCKKKLTI